MRIARWFTVALLAMCSAASAMQPGSGWYWNRSESGRGFNVDIQNNLLFMAGFIYDSAGKPIWVTAGGPMSSDRAFTAAGYLTSNGQCLGCRYTSAPTLTPFGQVSINWSDETHATITVNGVAIQVERQQFGVDLANTGTPLLGEWAFVAGTSLIGSSTVYFGERITFNSTFVSSGVLTATGNRSGAFGTTRLAVGQLNSAGWGILLDSSTSYYDLYTFRWTGLDTIEGNDFTFLKTSNPNGSLPFLASRIRSGAAAGGAFAPGTGVKAFEVPNAVESGITDAVNAAKSARAVGSASDDVQELARRLIEQLEASR